MTNSSSSFLGSLLESKQQQDRIRKIKDHELIKESSVDKKTDSKNEVDSTKCLKTSHNNESSLQVVLEDTSSRLTNSLLNHVYQENITLPNSICCGSIDSSIPYSSLDLEFPMFFDRHDMSFNKLEAPFFDDPSQILSSGHSQNWNPSLRELLTSHQLQRLMGFETQTQKENLFTKNPVYPKHSISNHKDISLPNETSPISNNCSTAATTRSSSVVDDELPASHFNLSHIQYENRPIKEVKMIETSLDYFEKNCALLANDQSLPCQKRFLVTESKFPPLSSKNNRLEIPISLSSNKHQMNPSKSRGIMTPGNLKPHRIPYEEPESTMKTTEYKNEITSLYKKDASFSNALHDSEVFSNSRMSFDLETNMRRDDVEMINGSSKKRRKLFDKDLNLHLKNLNSSWKNKNENKSSISARLSQSTKSKKTTALLSNISSLKTNQFKSKDVFSQNQKSTELTNMLKLFKNSNLSSSHLRNELMKKQIMNKNASSSTPKNGGCLLSTKSIQRMDVSSPRPSQQSVVKLKLLLRQHLLKSGSQRKNTAEGPISDRGENEKSNAPGLPPQSGMSAALRTTRRYGCNSIKADGQLDPQKMHAKKNPSQKNPKVFSYCSSNAQPENVKKTNFINTYSNFSDFTSINSFLSDRYPPLPPINLHRPQQLILGLEQRMRQLKREGNHSP